ncbi:MAG: MFS transporter [Micrococcaceae bacterium]
MTNKLAKAKNQKTLSRNAIIVSTMALFTDTLIMGVVIPVLPLLPSVVEKGPAATGILFASYAVMVVVSTLFTGRYVDRAGPKLPLLISLFALMAATLLFATGGPYWLLLIARSAQGLAGGVVWVAALSLITATTPFEKRGAAMGMAMSSTSVGSLMGPVISGFMVEHFGRASPFLLVAGLALLDGILRIILIKDIEYKGEESGGMTEVLKIPGSLVLGFITAVGAGIWAAIELVLPQHLNVSSLTIGLLFALASVASIIANPIVGYYFSKPTTIPFIGSGLALLIVSLLIIGFATEIWQTAVALFILGLATPLLLMPTTTLMSEQGYKVNPPIVGGTFAFFNLAYAGGMAVGPVLAGFAVQGFGFSAAMVITAVIFMIIGILTLRKFKMFSVA